LITPLNNWIPAGVYPDENRGRNDGERGFRTFYEIINFGLLGLLGISVFEMRIYAVLP